MTLDEAIADLTDLRTIVAEIESEIVPEYRAMVGKAEVDIPTHVTPGLIEATDRAVRKVLARRGLGG